MFFRRDKLKVPTFQELLERVGQAGFQVEHLSNGVRVRRGYCAALLQDGGAGRPHVSKAGVLIGDEVGWLVNGGYQQFFRAPSGKTEPALAEQLHALHDFEEDLKEALGLVSLYNESLGTTSDQHLYDRVLNRDRGVPVRSWERKRQPSTNG